MSAARDKAAESYSGVVSTTRNEPDAFKRQCFRDGWDAAIAAMPSREVTVQEAARVLVEYYVNKYAIAMQRPVKDVNPDHVGGPSFTKLRAIAGDTP